MSRHLSVSEVARQLGGGLRPRDISDLFYSRVLRDGDDVCPVVSGRRMIPVNYLPIIETALKRAGKLSQGASPVPSQC